MSSRKLGAFKFERQMTTKQGIGESGDNSPQKSEQPKKPQRKES